MPSLGLYLRALAAARRVGLSMTRVQMETFQRLLDSYADDFGRRVGAGYRRGASTARAVSREMSRQLQLEVTRATKLGVRLTAERVAEIYANATANVLGELAPGMLTVNLFPGLDARSAQAVLSRPQLTGSMVSIRRDSVAAADRIIARALLRGATPDQLAAELRIYVVGAEALPARLLVDRRRIGYEALRALGYEATPENLAALRGDSGKVAAKASLVARTEIMNAQHEAQSQGAAASPVVKAVRWETAGRHPKPDACDIMRDSDFYGLGPGVYDPRQVPPRAHPRCLCATFDVLYESPEDMHRGRGPVPARRLDPMSAAGSFGLPPSQGLMVAQALEVAEARAARRRAA